MMHLMKSNGKAACGVKAKPEDLCVHHEHVECQRCRRWLKWAIEQD